MERDKTQKKNKKTNRISEFTVNYGKDNSSY